MHAAKAALLTHEVVATGHAAVRRLFGQRLVRAGELEAEWAEILGRAQDRRVAADYNVDFEATAEIADALVHDARRFIERIQQYLHSQGIVIDKEDRS